MLTPSVEVQGTLTSDGTLFLDQAPDLPPGRVRVSLRPAGGGANGLEVSVRPVAETLAGAAAPAGELEGDDARGEEGEGRGEAVA